jgi:hypothetical protein
MNGSISTILFYLVSPVLLLLACSCSTTTGATHVVNDNEDQMHTSYRRRRLSRTRNLQAPVVTNFELINANTDVKIMDIVDGQVINVNNIVGLSAPAFNINAITTGSVSSVIFGFNTMMEYRTERSAPYALCGNNGPMYSVCTDLGYGIHTVTATPTLSGVAGSTVSIKFTIISSTPVPPPVKAPIIVPVVPAPVPTRIPTKVPVALVPVPVPIVSPSGSLPPIHTLRLMFTGVNPSTPVLNLTFDAVNVIDLRLLQLPSGEFNIDALVGPTVKSVVFSNGRIETSAPLAYCGNFGLDFYSCDDLLEGTTLTITVTAYTERGGSGIAIQSRSTTIQIVRSLPPVAPTPPIVAPIAPPARPPVPGCPVPKVSLDHCFYRTD